MSRVTVYACPMAEGKQRQGNYRQRMKARGLAELTVWCPERDKHRVRLYANRLTETFEKEQQAAKTGGSKER